MLGNRACFILHRIYKRSISFSLSSPHHSCSNRTFFSQNQLLKNSVDINSPTIFISDSISEDWDWSSEIHGRPRSTIDEYSIRLRGMNDPLELVQSHISNFSDSIKTLLKVDHPILEACAKYFFDLDLGKKIRPAIVLLVSRACNEQAGFHDVAPTVSQIRLAEITEMIHSASLFHDDVIDKADTRRNQESVNSRYGNKLAVLGGDFLLARASVSLSRLRNVQVVELLSTVIEHLVKGEVMQLKPINATSSSSSSLEYYMKKNYYKTASLIANSCKATAVLEDHTDELINMSFNYGRHIGLAFQVIDDVLDYTGSSELMGKPMLADVKNGLATAPLIFASEQFPQLKKMIERKFEGLGDVDEAIELVKRSDGILRSIDLATRQAELAIDIANKFTSTECKEALIGIALKVICRKH